MRPVCLLLVLVALLAGCRGAEEASVPPEPVANSAPTALVVRGGRLVEIDARTLEPLPGRAVHLQGHNGAIAMAPDGSRVAVGGAKSVRIVDLTDFDVVADLPKPHGYSRVVSWGDPDRIIVASEVHRQDRVDVLVLEAASGRLLSRRPFDTDFGSPFAAEATAGTVAFLLHPPIGLGSTRLVQTDAEGRSRLVRLERIISGVEYPDGVPAARFIWPALALNADGTRAYVVGAGDLVAEVDLKDGSVDYHELEPSASLAGRLWNWLEPTADAKSSDRTQLGALWLGDGQLAIHGLRTVATVDGEATEALGFRLVDTAEWSTRMVDPEVVSLDRSGGLVLAWGDLWDSGTGLRAYDLRGESVFQVLDDRPIESVTIVGARALARLAGEGRTVVVDLEDGRVVGATMKPALIPSRVVPVDR